MAGRSVYQIAVDVAYKGRGAKEADKDMGALALSTEIAKQKSAALEKEFKDLATAVRTGAKSFDEAEKEASKLNAEMGKLDNTAQKGGTSFAEMGTQFAAAGAILVGAGVAAKEVYEIIGEGAALDAAAGKFDNLSVSINSTGDALLGKMKQATKGLISDADLIAAGTDIMSLGLAKTEGGVVRMAAAVGALNLDMGVLALTLANDSTARLDSLGLSLEDVTKKKKELIASGFIGDAFDEAVLIALEEKMVLLGDASETAAGQAQILEAGFKNATDGLKQMVAQSGPVTTSLTRWTQLMNGVVEVSREVGNAQQDMDTAVALGLVTQEEANFLIKGAIAGYERQSEEVQALRDEVERLTTTYGASDELLGRYTVTQSNLTAAEIAAAEHSANLARTLDDLAISQSKAAGAAWDQAAAEEAAATAQDKAAEAARAGVEALSAAGFESGETWMEGYAQGAAVLTEVGVNAELAEIKVDNLQGKLLGFEPIYGTIVDVDTTAAQARVDRLAAALGSLGAARAIAGEGDVEGAARAATGPGGGNVGAPGSTQYAPGSTGNQGPARYTGEADYDPLGPGAANGANFTVPPGFPNDSFPMRVQSGEHVTVTPAGQQRQSGSPTYIFNNQTEAAQALALATVAQQKRARHSAYMGG